MMSEHKWKQRVHIKRMTKSTTNKWKYKKTQAYWNEMLLKRENKSVSYWTFSIIAQLLSQFCVSFSFLSIVCVCVCASALFFSPLISLLKTINTFWRTEEEEEKNWSWRFCRFSSFTPLFSMHLFVYTLSLVRGLRARGCEQSHTFSLIRSRFHTYINTHEEKEKKSNAQHNTLWIDQQKQVFL